MNSINEILTKIQSLLSELAFDTREFSSTLSTAFGNEFDVDRAEDLRQQWLDGNFSDFPLVDVRSEPWLDETNCIYSPANDTIYVSQTFLEDATDDTIVAAFIKEVGHAVDIRINALDSTVDSGAIFSALVQDMALAPTQMARTWQLGTDLRQSWRLLAV